MMDDDHHVNDLWEDMDRLNALYEELTYSSNEYVSTSYKFSDINIAAHPTH